MRHEYEHATAGPMEFADMRMRTSSSLPATLPMRLRQLKLEKCPCGEKATVLVNRSHDYAYRCRTCADWDVTKRKARAMGVRTL